MRRPSVLVSALAAVVCLFALATCAPATAADELAFTDVKAQTAKFIAWNDSIRLSPEQEAIKKKALTALPAPCCSDNTAYTCCCPCNMALSIWGLSNHLIAERGYDAEQVEAKVSEWVEFINPDGFSGEVCYTASCNKSFGKGGCGGMRAGHVIWDN